MKLVIDISDDIYHTILTTHDNMIFDSDSPYVAMAIKNGVPLPKCHGRIIDESTITTCEWNGFLKIMTTDAPTIIEADKGQE